MRRDHKPVDGSDKEFEGLDAIKKKPIQALYRISILALTMR